MDSPEEERNKTEDMNTGVHRDIQEANGIGMEYMLGNFKHHEVSSHCAALDPHLPCAVCCLQDLFSLLWLCR